MHQINFSKESPTLAVAVKHLPRLALVILTVGGSVAEGAVAGSDFSRFGRYGFTLIADVRGDLVFMEQLGRIVGVFHPLHQLFRRVDVCALEKVGSFVAQLLPPQLGNVPLPTAQLASRRKCCPECGRYGGTVSTTLPESSFFMRTIEIVPIPQQICIFTISLLHKHDFSHHFSAIILFHAFSIISSDPFC